MPPSSISSFSAPTDGAPGRSDRWWRFIAALLAAFAIAASLVAGANFVLLWRAGELMTHPHLIERQQETGGLYRSMFSDDIMLPYFRFERYDILLPEIIALGESRVLQFRQDSFKRPFANMAMTFDLSQLPQIAQALIARPNRLKVVILSIDFWQLAEPRKLFQNDANWNPRNRWTLDWDNMRNNFQELSAQYIVGAARLMRHRQVTFDQIRSVLCRCDAGGVNYNIGVAAIIDGAGIDASGSYHYTDVFSPTLKKSGFTPTLQLIDQKRGMFTPAERVSPDRLRFLRQAREILADAGVRVITIIPPMAPMVVRAMEDSGQYRIIDDMRLILNRDFQPSFDFHDARQLGSGNCEFYDALHGGDVTYLRVIERLAENENAELAPMIRRDAVHNGIKQFHGRVMSYDQPRSGDRSRRELDFLGLGCTKR